MLYTRDDIENIAVQVLRDYGGDQSAPLDLERFAGDFLGLTIRYESLSADGHLLGMTTYEDVELKIYGHGKADKGREYVAQIPKGTILISRLLLPENCDGFLRVFSPGRLRFTIAHECPTRFFTARTRARKSYPTASSAADRTARGS